MQFRNDASWAPYVYGTVIWLIQQHFWSSIPQRYHLLRYNEICGYYSEIKSFKSFHNLYLQQTLASFRNHMSLLNRNRLVWCAHRPIRGDSEALDLDEWSGGYAENRLQSSTLGQISMGKRKIAVIVNMLILTRAVIVWALCWIRMKYKIKIKLKVWKPEWF